MGQAIQLVEGETAADFKAPMILLNGFYHRVWSGCWCRLEGGMEVTDRIGQGWLIVLYRQNVIATPFPDALRDVRLRSHGIKGDDAAFQGQRGEQFRNRGLLVRFPGRRPSPVAPVPVPRRQQRR